MLGAFSSSPLRTPQHAFVYVLGLGGRHGVGMVVLCGAVSSEGSYWVCDSVRVLYLLTYCTYWASGGQERPGEPGHRKIGRRPCLSVLPPPGDDAGGMNTVRPAIVIELGGISYADGSIGPWLVSVGRTVECRRALSRLFVSEGVKLRRSTAVVRG